MAQQDSVIRIRGTIGNITFFRRNGKYFCMKKPSLSAERIRTDPAYAKTRSLNKKIGKCSKLAAAIYKLIPQQQKKARSWAKLLKCVINLALQNKPLEFIICQALFQFNVINGSEPAAERQRLCKEVLLHFPFTSLDPEEEHTSTPPESSATFAKDLLAQLKALQQLTTIAHQRMQTHTQQPTPPAAAPHPKARAPKLTPLAKTTAPAYNRKTPAYIRQTPFLPSIPGINIPSHANVEQSHRNPNPTLQGLTPLQYTRTDDS
jgi:hypothetical protein